MPASAYDVFVSYAQRDSAVVSQWVEELRRGGVRVFYEPFELPESRRSKQPLAEIIQSARLLLCFLSPHTLEAQNVSEEVTLAVNGDPDKPIVPVFLENVRPLGQLALILAHLPPIRAYELDAEALWRTVEASLLSADIHWRSPSPDGDPQAAPPPSTASPAGAEPKASQKSSSAAPRPAAPASTARTPKASTGQGRPHPQSVRALLGHPPRHSHRARRRLGNTRRSVLRARRAWLITACLLMPILSAAYLWQRSNRLTESMAVKASAPTPLAPASAPTSAPESPPPSTPSVPFSPEPAPTVAVAATNPPALGAALLPSAPSASPLPPPEPAWPAAPPPAPLTVPAPTAASTQPQPMALLGPTELAPLPSPSAPSSASPSTMATATTAMKLESHPPLDLVDPKEAEAVRIARGYYTVSNDLVTAAFPATPAGKQQAEAALAVLLATLEPNVQYLDEPAALTRAHIRKLIEEEQKKASHRHQEMTGDTAAHYLPTEAVWECRTPITLTWEHAGIARHRADFIGLIRLRANKGDLKITTVAEVPDSRKTFAPEFIPAGQEKAAIELAQKAVTAFDSRTKLDPATLAACFAPELRFFGEIFTSTEELYQYLQKVAKEFPVREHYLSTPAPAITQTLDGKLDTVTVLLSYKLRTAADQVSPSQPWHISVNVRFDPQTATPKVISQSLIRSD